MVRSGGRCTFCGSPNPATRDHIPPRCLFPSGDPGNLIAVRCCETCRQGTSLDDEHFKNMLLLRHDVGGTPQIEALRDSVVRAYSNPKKRGQLKALFRSMGSAEVRTGAGIILGERATYTVEAERMARVVDRIIRGLYRHETRKLLPEGVLVRSMCVNDYEPPDPEAFKALVQFVSFAKTLEERSVGHGHFRYRTHSDFEGVGTSFWFLEFYDAVWFMGFTAHANALPSRAVGTVSDTEPSDDESPATP